MATIDNAIATQPRSELSLDGVATTTAAAVGLSFGPSVIGVLSFGVFIRPIEEAFGWSRVDVSLAVTVISYMVMLVSPIQGMLVDRFGPRRIVLASIPVFAVSVALFYFMPSNLAAFYVLAALLPLAGIGLWPLSYLQAVSRWFDRRLGLALGIANAGIGLGSTLVPLIATAILVAYGWREMFLGLAAVVLFVTWPVAYFGLRESASNERAANAASSFGLSFSESVRQPSFRILVAVFFMLGLATTALVTQQAPLLIDAGWSPARAAAVMSTFGVAVIVARIGVGLVIDHVFAPFVMLTITAGGALACVLYATTPDYAFVGAALVGLLVGAEFDVLAFLIKRYFGTAAFGKLYGTIFAAFQLAAGIGVAGLSMSQERFGGYGPGMLTLAGALVAAAILQAFFGPYRYAAKS
jgi:predicted MFS family arabinose efflux permease